MMKRSCLPYASTSLIRFFGSVEYPFQYVFLRLKHLLNILDCATITSFTCTQIGLCCVCGIGSMTDFSHMLGMLDDAKMMYGLYPFFYFALLNDFSKVLHCERVSSYMNPPTFPPHFHHHCVLVYPHVVLWLLKSLITM